MKKMTIGLIVSLGVVFFVSCSKDKDCICVSTTTEDGVVTNTSTTTNSLETGIPGPFGNAIEEDCDNGDSYSSDTSFGTTYVYETKCELE